MKKGVLSKYSLKVILTSPPPFPFVNRGALLQNTDFTIKSKTTSFRKQQKKQQKQLLISILLSKSLQLPNFLKMRRWCEWEGGDLVEILIMFCGIFLVRRSKKTLSTALCSVNTAFVCPVRRKLRFLKLSV